MHKNFVKILPLAAAVLLATSCSKDENKETFENNEVVNSETSLELPFSVTVKTGSSLSKIKCEDGTSGVETTFNQTDLDNHVKMVVTGTGITEGDLFLIDLNGTFEGKLKFKTEEAKNAVIGSSVTLSATVKINENSIMKWSPNSLEDLIQGCEHTYDVSKTDDGNITPFYYGDKDLVLYDNNSYIEVIWKNKGNAEIDINENPYTLNDNGKGWLMITPNIVIESSTLGITDGTHKTVKGQIHTISRIYVEGFVDLGIKDDKGRTILWATKNLYADNPWDSGNYYAWGETTTKTDYSWDKYKYKKQTSTYGAYLSKYCTVASYGDVDNKTKLDDTDDAATLFNSNWHIPTHEDWDALIKGCDVVQKTDYDGHSVRGYLYKSKSISGAEIFLPRVGYFSDATHNDGIYYWSSSLNTNNDFEAWEYNTGGMSSLYRYRGLPIRPVMYMD